MENDLRIILSLLSFRTCAERMFQIAQQLKIDFKQQLSQIAMFSLSVCLTHTACYVQSNCF